MILSRLEGDAQIRAQVRCPQFGHQLLAGIAGIAEPLASELAVQPRGMRRPVRQLVCRGRGVALDVAERLQHRQLG